MLKDRGRVDAVDLAPAEGVLPTPADRIAELERELAQLREALVNRQRYGVVTGALAVRFGISPDRAWQLLVRLSQHSNLKVRVVTGILHDRLFGHVAPQDEPIADELDGLLTAHLDPLRAEATDGPPGPPLTSWRRRRL